MAQLDDRLGRCELPQHLNFICCAELVMMY